MAVPGDDFLNQASDEVVAVLKADPDFMSPKAANAPLGAKGVVVFVEDDLPETTNVPQGRLPHCSVVYLGDDPKPEDSGASETDILIQIGLRFYHRGADRKAVWRALKKAAASVQKAIAKQVGPDGGQFNGFCDNAIYQGGAAIDTQEQTGFGAMQLVRISLQITRPDYEEA